MQEEHGQKTTRASIEGSRLHDAVAASEHKVRERHQIIPIVIIIAAIIIGYLWIFG
ncbi:MAG: hypothetical protein ACTSSE_08230 [Candidatus Thorarchaeota archaeon]